MKSRKYSMSMSSPKIAEAPFQTSKFSPQYYDNHKRNFFSEIESELFQKTINTASKVQKYGSNSGQSPLRIIERLGIYDRIQKTNLGENKSRSRNYLTQESLSDKEKYLQCEIKRVRINREKSDFMQNYQIQTAMIKNTTIISTNNELKSKIKKFKLIGAKKPQNFQVPQASVENQDHKQDALKKETELLQNSNSQKEIVDNKINQKNVQNKNGSHELNFVLVQDGDAKSVDLFKVLHFKDLERDLILETIMNDTFGRVGKHEFQITSFKVKHHGILKEFQKSLRLSSSSNLEFIIQTQSRNSLKCKPLDEETGFEDRLIKLENTYDDLVNKDNFINEKIDGLKQEINNEILSLRHFNDNDNHLYEKLKKIENDQNQKLIRFEDTVFEKIENKTIQFTNSFLKNLEEKLRLDFQNEVFKVQNQNNELVKQFETLQANLQFQTKTGISNHSQILKDEQSLRGNSPTNQSRFEILYLESEGEKSDEPNIIQENLQKKSNYRRNSQKCLVPRSLQFSKKKVQKNYSQQLVEETNLSQKTQKYDMAFLYADPIIKKDKKNPLKMVETYMPLDLEKEYNIIKENISMINKEFSIKKIAVNGASLQRALQDNPKIIHVSCHGDYNHLNKSFYLAFEEEFTGEQIQFSEQNLKLVMGSVLGKHQIKLAFVNACHSERMGNIFFKAGVPVVVCVQASQQIDDDCCKEFSRQFYKNLVNGETVKNSFKLAQDLIQVKDEKFKPCCCAHNHSKNCWWFHLYQEDPQKAHELHSHSCSCDTGGSGTLHNASLCPVFTNFEIARKQEKHKMRKFEKSQSIFIQNENEQSKQQASVMNPVTLNFFAQISSDDDLELSSSDDEDYERGLLCCCKPSLIHNEALKFQLLYSEEYDILNDQLTQYSTISQEQADQIRNRIADSGNTDKDYHDEIDIESLIKIVEKCQINWQQIGKLAFENSFKRVNFMQFLIAAQKGYSILDSQIFVDQPDGCIIEQHSFKDQIFNFPKIKRIGRHYEIHNLLKFLSGNDEKVYFIHDNDQKCSKQISKYCVWYLKNRDLFKNGSYEIDMKNKKLMENIYQNLQEQMNVGGSSLQEIKNNLINFVQNQHLCFILTNCDEIISNDSERLFKGIEHFVSKTNYLKIIVITSRKQTIEVKQTQNLIINQDKYEKIEKKYQLQIMVHLIKESKGQHCIELREIINHKLFEEYDMTVEEIVKMFESNMSLDSIYEQKREQELNNKRDIAQSRYNKILNSINENQHSSKYQEILTFMHLISCFPAGLQQSDFNKMKEFQDGLNIKITFNEVIKFFDEFGMDNQSNYIVATYDGQDNRIEKVLLNESIQEYIYEEIILKRKYEPNLKSLIETVLEYFSSKARQAIAKPSTYNNFDLYILSCKINSGLWASPFTMTFDTYNYDTDITKEKMLYQRDTERNIFFQLKLAEDGVFQLNESSYIDSLFSECILCVTSVLLEREQYDRSLQIIGIGIRICQDLNKNDPLDKLMLMKASILIVQKIDQKIILTLLKEIEQNKNFQTDSIQGELYYLKSVNDIIQIQSLEDQGTNEIYENKNSLKKIDQKVQRLNISKSFKKPRNEDNKTNFQQGHDLKNIIIQNLIKSIGHFSKAQDKIGKAKATFLKNEFIIDNQAGFMNESMCDELKEIEDDLIENKNFQIIAESNLIQAKIYLENKMYQEARTSSKLALNYFKDNNLNDLRKISAGILLESSKELKDKQQNFFVFAFSSPIIQNRNQDQLDCLQNVQFKFIPEVIKIMNNSGKQIDYAIEILNEDFLKRLPSCHVLHLKPRRFHQDLSKNNDYLSIEDQHFTEIIADQKYLEQKLLGNDLGVQISFVILQIPNCENLAKWFLKKMNVGEVVYFKVENTYDLKSQEIIQHQNANDITQEFMERFMIELYSSAFKSDSHINFKDFIRNLNEIITLEMKVKNIRIQAKTISKDKTITFDNLKMGSVLELSQPRAFRSSFGPSLSKLPIFLNNRGYDQFKQILDKFTGSKKQIINIYGPLSGEQKINVVLGVANYLMMRYYFLQGVFQLDANESEFIEVFDQMCKQLKQNKCQQIKNVLKNKKVKKEEQHGQENLPKNNCLIIMKTDYGQKDQKLMTITLKDIISKIQIETNDFVLVLISQHEIKFQQKQSKHVCVKKLTLETFNFNPLDNYEMKMTFLCLINNITVWKHINDHSFADMLKYTEDQIIPQIKGNLNVVEIISLIAQLNLCLIPRIIIQRKEEHNSLQFENTMVENKIQKIIKNDKEFKLNVLPKSQVNSALDGNNHSLQQDGAGIDIQNETQQNVQKQLTISLREDQDDSCDHESECGKSDQENELNDEINGAEIIEEVNLRNSEDGIVIYKDIYVRALSYNNQKLFIVVKDDDQSQALPKFYIFKKKSINSQQGHYVQAKENEIKQIIIYVAGTNIQQKSKYANVQEEIKEENENF